MDLYNDEGWLNVPEIAKLNMPFNIIIGARQVGKTYGVIDDFLKNEKMFIYMRRLNSELEYAMIEDNTPFVPHEGYCVRPIRDSKYTFALNKYLEDGSMVHIGEAVALTSLSKIRGFDGSMYTDLLYDEFIPEVSVAKISGEGDAFLNGMVSLSGNRELEGKSPLKVWLCANSNNLASPILQAFDIQTKVEEMIKNQREFSIMPDKGIFLAIPHSEKVIEKRQQTALYKAIGKSSDFKNMSLYNQFAYNDFSDIGHVNIREYEPFVKLSDVCIYRHKDGQSFYVTNYQNQRFSFSYAGTDKELKKAFYDFPRLRFMYIQNNFIFENYQIKVQFLQYIDKIF